MMCSSVKEDKQNILQKKAYISECYVAVSGIVSP